MESRSLEELTGQLGDQDGRRRQRVRETLVAIGEAALPSASGVAGEQTVTEHAESTRLPDAFHHVLHDLLGADN